MMSATGGGSLAQCAGMMRGRADEGNVGRNAQTAGGGSERSRRRERVYLKRNGCLEGPKLASNGRPVFDGSMTALYSGSVIKRFVAQSVKCEVRKVKVRLRLDHQIAFGEHLALLGSSESAGSWSNRIMMEWTEAGWVVDLEADPGETIEYKYIIVTGDGSLVWEHGANRVLVVPNDLSKLYQVVSHWSATGETVEVEVVDGAQSPEDGATEAEREFTNEAVDFEGIGEPQSPNDGVTEVENEAIDKEVIEGTEAREGGETETEKGNTNGSSNFEESDSPEYENSGFQGEGIAPLSSTEGAPQTVGKWDTTGMDNPSKPLVRSDQNPGGRWGRVSILVVLLIMCGFVILSKNYLSWKSPTFFLQMLSPESLF